MDPRGLAWFRVYADWLSHPKVQRLSEVDQRRHIGILCLACAGRLDVERPDDIAFELRITEAEARETVERLKVARLLTPGGEVWNWQDRQPKRDVSTDRTRRFRQRHKTDDGAATCDGERVPEEQGTRSERVWNGARVEESRGEESRSSSSSSSSSTQKKNKNVEDTLAELDPESVRLAELLRALIVRNDPLARVPEIQSEGAAKWAQEIERTNRIDGRSWLDIGAAIKYTQQDTFWRSNVLSPAKLRKQFPMIFLRMQANGVTGAPAATITREIVADLEFAIAEGDDLDAWIAKQPHTLRSRLREMATARSGNNAEQAVQ